MLKDITKSKEAIAIKNSNIKRTFEHVLDDPEAFNRRVNEQIREYEQKLINSWLAAKDIRCYGMPKEKVKTKSKKIINN